MIKIGLDEHINNKMDKHGKKFQRAIAKDVARLQHEDMLIFNKLSGGGLLRSEEFGEIEKMPEYKDSKKRVGNALDMLHKAGKHPKGRRLVPRIKLE